jgi:hypothetical protein
LIRRPKFDIVASRLNADCVAMSDDEEYEYDYGSDAEYDYGSDGGNENEENEGADDGVIEIENSFYGTKSE